MPQTHSARRFAALVIAAFLHFAAMAPAQDAAGRVEGTVRFLGTVPPPEKIITSDGMVLMHSDLVVDAKSKGLRDVAVYLDGARAQPPAKNAKPVVIDQKDMVFMPRVV